MIHWFILISPASAANWYVNDTSTTSDSFASAHGYDTQPGTASAPFRNITKAFDSAVGGDTIFVDAGVYDSYVWVSSTETAGVNITKDSITIIGAGSEKTIIDPPGANSISTMFGIYADTQSGLTIKNLGVTGAYIGVKFVNVDTSTLDGDSVSANNQQGIQLLNYCDSITIIGDTVSFNGSSGVMIDLGRGNHVGRNVVSSNSFHGIYLIASTANTLRGNTVNSNTVMGMMVESGSTGNLVDSNTLNSNNVIGMELSQGADNNRVLSNTLTANPTGMTVYASSWNVIANNLLRGNTSDGFEVSSCTHNVFAQNTLDSNRVYQVTIVGTSSYDTFIKNNFRTSSSNPDSVVSNTSTNSFDFSRNWWDTTDELVIDKRISDTGAPKKITFRPYRLGVVDTGAGTDTTAPLPQSGVTCTAATGYITVTWAIPTISEETNGGTVGYAGAKIYRLTSADTTNWANPASLVRTSSSTETQWNDTGATTAGTTYYYRLTSFDSATYVNQSYFTDTKSATVSGGNTTWYVNDTYSSSTDSFTYAGGADTSWADGTTSKPYRSVAKVLQSAKSGDTIYVDAGLYAETYVLVSATETAAFKIDTDNITIIGKDSNATVINTPGDSSTPYIYGIYSDTQTGLTIKNLGVTGSYEGIYFMDVDKSTITGDSVGSVGNVGVYLAGGSETNTISNNQSGYNLGANGYGIVVSGGSFNTINNNITSVNKLYGIHVQNSKFDTITNNTTDSNLAYGVYVYLTDTVVVRGNTVTASGNEGVIVDGGSFVQVTLNQVDSNVRTGIDFLDAGGATPIACVVDSNVVRYNQHYGIGLAPAKFTIVRNNLIAYNTRAGFYISGSDTNAIVQNDIIGSDTGIYITGASNGNTVSKNNIRASVVNYIYNEASKLSGVTQTSQARNWFDTTDEVTITAKYSDTVNAFRPYRLGTVDTKSASADTTAPGLPASVSVSADSIGQIAITWTIPTINEETNGGSVGYTGAKIYRQTNTVDTTNWANSANLVWTASSSATSWTDTTTAAGNTYYYRLTSFDAASYVNQSFFTDTKSAKATRSIWYVNDTYSSSTDSFTYAGGADTSWGEGSASKPYRSVAKAMQSVKSGDTIYVDAGLYNDTYVHVTATETAAFKIDTDNIIIIGKDSGATVIDPPGANSISTAYGIYADSQTGITIKNLGVTGAYIGVLFENVDSSTLSGDSISGNGAYGILLRVGSETNTITNNLVISNGFYGIYLSSSHNDTIFNNLVNNYLFNSNTYNVYMTQSQNNLVRSNVLNMSALPGAPGFGYGVYISECTGVVVDSNQIHSNPLFGVYVVAGKNHILRDNLIDSNGTGIFLGPYFGQGPGPTGSIILNNSIDSFSGFGVALFSCTNTLVRGNRVRGQVTNLTDSAGIRMDSSDSNSIFQNQISDVDTGIWISGASNANTIVKNDVIACTLSLFNSAARDFGLQQTLTRNWWDTTDEVTIASRFGDTLSTFRPYRLGPVDTRAAADTTAPGLPATVTLDTSTPGTIKLTWTIPTINEETNGGSLGYTGAKIYRLTNTKDTTNWANTASLVRTTSSTETTWTDTTVTFGNTYYYRLTSFDAAAYVNQSFFTDTKWDSPTSYASVKVFEDASLADEVDTYLTRDVMFIEVRDTDENKNSGSAETVTVTAYVGNGTTESDSAGLVLDTETIILTESGAATGIFRCSAINLTDTKTPQVNDGFLSWGRSDTLHVKYVDGNDATDSASDTALALEIASTAKVQLYEDTAFTDDVDTYITRDLMNVEVTDTDENRNPQIKDTIAVTAYIGQNTNGLVTDTEVIVLTESGETTGVFRRDRFNLNDTATVAVNNNFLTWATSDTLYVVYTDLTGGTTDSASDTALLVDTAAQSYTGPIWYVNDTSTTGDTYTSATGSDTDGVGSATSPYRTIIFALTKMKSGETLYIDAGIYDSYVNITSTESAGVKIDTDNLTLIGKDSSSTVIDPPGANSITTMYGIYADTQTGLIIKNLGVTGASTGINFYNVDQSTITGDSACSNAIGIFLGTGSDMNTVSNNTVSSNSFSGIYLRSSSNNNTVTSNTASSNSAYGIYLYSSSNDTVTSNTASSNSAYGIYLYLSSNNNTVTSNTASSNSTVGIALESNSDTNTVTSNTASSNSGVGIFLYSSSNNRVSHNKVASNTSSGISISSGSDTNAVVLNDISGNDTGVDITGASRSNVISKNNIFGNDVSSVYNVGGLSHTLTRNYWGTTDEITIDTDFEDTANTFIPYRIATVDTTVGGDTTAPLPPVGFTIDTATTVSITLSWTIPTVSEETNGGSVGYSGAKIYRLRNQKDTSNWANSANLVFITTSAATSWVDTTATGGDTYYYRMVSFDAATFINHSGFTDTKSIALDSAWSGPQWYVNDTYSSSADSFTLAGGSDTSWADGSRSKPFRSLAKVSQKLEAGDTIYVDAGRYADTFILSDNAQETAALEIETDYITVIGKDSNATVIDPPGSGAGVYGIYADTQKGITIKNLGVTGAYDGIKFVNVDASTLTGDSIGACGNNGVYLLDGSDTNRIEFTTSDWNAGGVYLYLNCKNNTIETNTASSNTIYGIGLQTNADSNVVYNNVAKSNSLGVYIGSGSYNKVDSNTTASNTVGVKVTSGSGNWIMRNMSTSNTSYGIYLEIGTSGNSVESNTVSSQLVGIVLSTSSSNRLSSNTAKSNTYAGIHILDSDTNYVTQNDITANDTGIYLNGSSINNLIVKNNIYSNNVSSVYNASGRTQTLTRNWWGTTNEVAIDTDFEDTANDFRPYRLGAVDTRANVDTTAPGLPASVSLDTTTTFGYIIVNWTIPTINEETNGGSVGYAGAKIYRIKNARDTTGWGDSINLVFTASSAATSWTDTGVSTGDTFYYRLTSIDGATYVNQSFFTDTKASQPAGVAASKWYVNDTYSSSTDSFTYAGGSDTSYGDGTASKPYRSVAKALQSAKAADTIFVDAGLYSDTFVVVSSGSETAAFKIDTDYISIIGKDSNATVIDPPGSRATYGLYGIYATGRKSLLIQNLGVTGAHTGIYFSNVDSSRITGDSVTLNDSYGIKFQNGCESNYVANNTVESNAHTGIHLSGSFSNAIINNIANFNGSGIAIDGGSETNLVKGNTANSNKGGAADLEAAGVGVEVSGGSRGNLIAENTLNSNIGVGMVASETAAGNMFRNNIAKSNTWAGIAIVGGETNAFIANEISGGDTGVWIFGNSRNNLITKNNITSNAINRLYSTSSRDTGLSQTVTRNWWGTTDEVTILSKFSDTASAFRPYRLEPVDTSVGADTTAPAPPTSVSVSASGSYIAVSWTIPTINEETNGGSVGYSGLGIFRLKNSADTTNWANDTNLVWTASSAATSWTDTTVTTGSTYYYRLVSFDTTSSSFPKNHSFFTDTKSATATTSTTSGGADSMSIVSGNHQLGEALKALTDSFVVKITDSAGSARANVPVRFTITQEPSEATFGEVDADEVDPSLGETSANMSTLTFTDTNGQATETFTLGELCGLYRVSASTDSNGSLSETFYIYADAVDIPKTTWKMVSPNVGASSAAVAASSLDVVAWKSGATDLTGSSALAEVDAFSWDEAAGVSAALSDYDELTSASSIERGRSYWMYSTSYNIHVGEASPARSFDTVTVALTAGWHMISSGQPFYINWYDGVRFDTNAATESAKFYPSSAEYFGLIKNVIYWYTGSGYYWGPDTATPALSEVQLKPMIGFWIFTNVACTMTVYPNPKAPRDTATQILAQAPQLAAKYTDGGGNDADWLVRLTAQSGDRVDFQNYVGVKPTAEAASRAAVYDPPPAAGKYVSLGIVDEKGSRYAASYSEPITTAKAWKVSVASDLDSPVTLTWENVSSLPSKYAAYLIGGPTGIVDLRKTASLVLPKSYGSGTLTLAVGLPEYMAAFLAATLSKDQTFVYPNPGPDGTTGSMTFAYNLQDAAEATIRIFDVGGKLVRELKGNGAVGNNTLVWDTTNRHGQKLGSGVYIYIITSGGNKIVDKLAIVR